MVEFNVTMKVLGMLEDIEEPRKLYATKLVFKKVIEDRLKCECEIKAISILYEDNIVRVIGRAFKNGVSNPSEDFDIPFRLFKKGSEENEEKA